MYTYVGNVGEQMMDTHEKTTSVIDTLLRKKGENSV